jgi:hypothetical protein
MIRTSFSDRGGSDRNLTLSRSLGSHRDALIHSGFVVKPFGWFDAWLICEKDGKTWGGHFAQIAFDVMRQAGRPRSVPPALLDQGSRRT